MRRTAVALAFAISVAAIAVGSAGQLERAMVDLLRALAVLFATLSVPSTSVSSTSPLLAAVMVGSTKSRRADFEVAGPKSWSTSRRVCSSAGEPMKLASTQAASSGRVKRLTLASASCQSSADPGTCRPGGS